MMIFVYWGILILCYFIASRLRNMASRFGFLDKSMMAAVYILVFLMGLRMGINRQVTSALATIGVRKKMHRSRSTEARRARQISRARWESCL